jgi:hypothetical protein
LGDNPGIIITEQLIEAHRQLMTELTSEPVDPQRVRSAARGLRIAQISAGWSASESEADAREIIRGLLYGDPGVPQLRPHGIPQLHAAAAVTEGFGLLIELHAAGDLSKIH